VWLDSSRCMRTRRSASTAQKRRPGDGGRLRYVKTGDTITFPQNPVVLESMEFLKPVISIAVEPNKIVTIDKVKEALAEARR